MGKKQLSLIIQHLGIADVKTIHSLVSVQEQIPGKFKQVIVIMQRFYVCQKMAADRTTDFLKKLSKHYWKT